MGLIEPAPEAPESRPVGRLISAVLGDRRRAILVTLGTGLVFFAHFRPWQGSLVEEWGMILAWEQNGFAQYFDPTVLEGTLARPLLLLPVYLVLEVARGSVVGLYAAAALLAVAQMFLARWALSPTGASNGTRWALGLAVALHPWWISGYAIRYFSAQVAITLCIVWFGATVRYLHRGTPVWAVTGVVALLVGCLTYPAPALTVFFGLAALLLVGDFAVRRAAIASAATAGTIGVYGLWSLIIAPRLGSTYESEIMSRYDVTPVQAVKSIVRTIALLSPGLVGLLVLAAVVVVSLGFSQVLSPARAWIALMLVGGTAGAALVYYPSLFHLASAEHIHLAVGLSAWLVLCGIAVCIDRSPRLRRLVQVVTVLCVVAAAVAGHVVWGRYAAGQQSILELAADVRDEVPEGERLVVADGSGYYGSLYLLLPPYIDIAVRVFDGPGPETVLCTETGVARRPNVATPDCATLIESPGASFLDEGATAYGEVAFYSVPIEQP